MVCCLQGYIFRIITQNLIRLRPLFIPEHIGKGEIDLTAFQLLLNDPRVCDHPMTLETPKGKDLAEDCENLALSRSL